MALLTDESKELLAQQLIDHEGVEQYPYKCTAGKLTIGVGRNLEDCGLSQDEAFMLLNNDIERVEQELANKIEILPQLTEVRRAVLINMAFNLGVNGLLKFRQMFAALENQDYQTAAEEMLNSRWADQVGRRSTELADMMLSNEWTERFNTGA